MGLAEGKLVEILKSLREVDVICVLARIRLEPGTRERFLQIFSQVVPKVRAEQGCIEYGPLEAVPTNIPTQIREEAETVYVLEKWESLEALEKHLVAPHMVEYRREVRPMVKEVGLYILRPIEP